MASKVPVLGVRYLGNFGLTRESTRGPALRLGRGDAPLVPGERAVARCRPYLSQRALGLLRPRSLWRMPGGAFLREEHEPPAENCACGIYAWNAIGPEFTDTYLGVYLGWGHVYHGKGYWRAQYVKPLMIGKLGRPERFDCEGDRARWIESIAKRYDIPLLEGEDIAKRYDIPLLEGEDIDRYATLFGQWPEGEAPS